MKILAKVRIPQEIITAQGTNFMSQLMRVLCSLLKIKNFRMLVYHPQPDRLMERFNKTFEEYVRKFIAQDLCHQSQLLPPLLFAIHKVPQALTRFSLFELLDRR